MKSPNNGLLFRLWLRLRETTSSDLTRLEQTSRQSDNDNRNLITQQQTNRGQKLKVKHWLTNCWQTAREQEKELSKSQGARKKKKGKANDFRWVLIENAAAELKLKALTQTIARNCPELPVKTVHTKYSLLSKGGNNTEYKYCWPKCN